MRLKMGCKAWTRGTQFGLRVYTNTINFLLSELKSISHIAANELDGFIRSLSRGHRVPAYSRQILILSPRKTPISATLTIAKHGHTTQGYITAPLGSWLFSYVQRNLGQDYDYEYIPGDSEDYLLIPFKEIPSEPKPEEMLVLVNTKINKYCKKNGIVLPPDADKIGLYYEIMECAYLKSQGLIAYHRFPFLRSKVTSLLKYNISCDIDVFKKNRNFLKFVEVKSISASPGSRFILTKNEFESREKCKKNNRQYEIVVYYHIGEVMIERHSIDAARNLLVESASYWCKPE